MNNVKMYDAAGNRIIFKASQANGVRNTPAAVKAWGAKRGHFTKKDKKHVAKSN